MARIRTCFVAGVLVGLVCLAWGCQVNHRTEETRRDEQMLAVSFENERAEELFVKAVKTTYGDVMNVKRIGIPGLSVYSRAETVAWNANCNDHIRRIDTDGNLVITEQEATVYCESLPSQ